MLRARDIADIVEDLAIERASVTVKEGWDHTPQFWITFGPLAYRQTMEIDPNLSVEAVRAKLEAASASPLLETLEYTAKQWAESELALLRRGEEAARASFLAEAPSPTPEAKPSPAAPPRASKRKRAE